VAQPVYSHEADGARAQSQHYDMIPCEFENPEDVVAVQIVAACVRAQN
jgi:hypothetical protein